MKLHLLQLLVLVGRMWVQVEDSTWGTVHIQGNLFQMIWHKDIPKSKYLLMKFFHMCGRSLIAFLIIKCSKDL